MAGFRLSVMTLMLLLFMMISLVMSDQFTKINITHLGLTDPKYTGAAIVGDKVVH